MGAMEQDATVNERATESDLLADALLRVASACASEILRAESVARALPSALRQLAQVVRVDRMFVVEVRRQQAGSFNSRIFFAWQADEAPSIDPVQWMSDASSAKLLHEWLSPVRQGKPVMAVRRLISGPLHDVFAGMHVVSTLQMPIMMNGVYWGHIVFDNCRDGHEWTPVQTHVLKLFAELVGAAVTREESDTELRRRDALLSGIMASAVEMVTAPYLQEAITKSLEKVAAAVRADRLIVFEVGTQGKGPLVLWSAWCSPDIPLGLDVIFGNQAGPPIPEMVDWMAALARGNPIERRTDEASSGEKEFFGKLQIKSTLMVPIMVDGKFWGSISFDDCRQERDFTGTEVDTLKLLAELIGTSITRERYMEELSKANTIVQNSPTILYRLRGEPSFPMIYVSQNIALLGYEADELLGSPTLYHSYVHPQDRSKVQGSMVELLRKNAAPITIEFRMMTNSGESRWMENRYTPVRDTNGRLVEVEGIMIDITERKHAEERISQLARTDALTGLANRATFNDRLRQSFAATQRGAKPFAVLYLDLDRFKEVNDSRGHPVGDKLLQAVSERLKNVTRETDVVARLGGDEFAILQSDVADPGQAGTLATKIVDTLSKPYPIDGQECNIGTSVGIAVFIADTESPEALLAYADQALYRAKEEGRGQYRFHSEELDAQARDRATLANDLRRAIEHDELELYYQPQVELSSGQIVGMEALVRWNHPTRGLLLPAVFLPTAEKSGMIQALGRWVLNGACKQLAAWRAEGVQVPVMAVNVALSQIKTGREFVRDVQNSLARWGLQPSDLELDVTEFILARTTLAQSDVLEELQRMGVCIAIDDFGAQYSSLDYLRTYHVGRLKIARPMVAAAQEERGSSMIRAIVGLAAELGVEVVAEGVETAEQRAVLVNMNANAKGQGFYFSQPMPVQETTEVLRSGLAAATEEVPAPGESAQT